MSRRAPRPVRGGWTSLRVDPEDPSVHCTVRVLTAKQRDRRYIQTSVRYGILEA